MNALARALASVAALALLQGQSPSPAPSPPPFSSSRGWLRMTDGVRLSATYWIPQGAAGGSRFPAVLEVLPYRKDDDFALRDYQYGAYFARHGIAYVRVDGRGTGSSEGALPDREYSDAELADIETAIDELAAMPWSNGKIGIQGISWSAFNGIMTAMRRPSHLAGILVAHGTQDLYGNDIHYIDGIMHLDVINVFELQNIVPRSPQYPIDAAYFADRFDRPPWMFAYLRHQRDGAWWEHGRSLQTDYASIGVPSFAIGGLLDGYRDFAIDMIAHLKAPSKAQIGPWNHAYPNDGEPGPNYDFYDDATQWWQQVLAGKDTGACCDPKLLVFVRGSVPPGVDLKTTPGSFWATAWPIPGLRRETWYPQAGRQLSTSASTASTDTLAFRPSSGAGALNWWGETTPDMRDADRETLAYDSPPLGRELRIVGNPSVRLRVSADAPLANWVVRLEDLRPDGSVSFITGAARSGAQRLSRVDPRPLVPGERFTLRFPLHFTTWTFAKGDRIRMVVSNAQFPMFWPTPYRMTTALSIGDGATRLELPVVSGELPAMRLRGPEPAEPNPDGKSLDTEELTPFSIASDGNGHWTAKSSEGFGYEIDGRTVRVTFRYTYTIDDAQPWRAGYLAEGKETIALPGGREIVLDSTLRMTSDRRFFHAAVLRTVAENGRVVRTRTFTDDVPRDFQ
jgi:putative CocE/NonD family hydrolase